LRGEIHEREKNELLATIIGEDQNEVQGTPKGLFKPPANQILSVQAAASGTSGVAGTSQIVIRPPGGLFPLFNRNKLQIITIPTTTTTTTPATSNIQLIIFIFYLNELEFYP
jgi:hypothetical protein